MGPKHNRAVRNVVGGREREGGERKYNQFINKLSRALPIVRARSGYIHNFPVGRPTPNIPDVLPYAFSPISCTPSLPPTRLASSGVSRYRTGAASAASM